MLLSKTAGDTSDSVPWILESCHSKTLPAFLRAGFSLVPSFLHQGSCTRLQPHWMLSSHMETLHLWQCSLIWGQSRGMGFGHIKGLPLIPFNTFLSSDSPGAYLASCLENKKALYCSILYHLIPQVVWTPKSPVYTVFGELVGCVRV